jgi:membrane-bound metal-dependent hydrolase YbcI (DUF457 family)
MTTPEHTLVGIHAAIALRAHQHFGWTVIVLAGIVSNFPDWDGLPMLFDMARFESGHRVWGHNFFWITFSSLLAAWSERRYRWIEFFAMRLRAVLPKDLVIEQPTRSVPWFMLFLVCFAAQTLHLPCDMVVSGGHGLPDWPIKPFWPISDAEYVFPLIPWGDVGPTVIMMAGAILLAKSPTRLSRQSTITLAVLCIYLLIRGWMRGML